MLWDSGTTWGNESSRHHVKATPFCAANCHRVLCELVEGHEGPCQSELLAYGSAETLIQILSQLWMKISVSMDISVLWFYGYIGDITVDIFTKIPMK